MSIISEKVDGKVISVEINSTNLKSASYDTENKVLTVAFKNGHIYEYYDFPWENFVKFRSSPSQGIYLGSEINGKYKYKRISKSPY